MLSLVAFNAIPLAVALVIGIVTARWAFARPRPDAGPQKEDKPAS